MPVSKTPDTIVIGNGISDKYGISSASGGGEVSPDVTVLCISLCSGACQSSCSTSCATSCSTSCGSTCATSCATSCSTSCSSSCWSLCSGGGSADMKVINSVEDIIL